MAWKLENPEPRQVMERNQLLIVLPQKYTYPPEELEDIIQIVIAQCEMWTDEGENY